MKSRGPSTRQYVDHDRQPEQASWRMIFTQRDGRILEHIHEYDGFLADYQIQELEFTGMRQSKHRLGKLFHNGYLSRTSRMGRTRYGCMIYWLTRQGAEHVANVRGESLGDLGWVKEPRWSKVEHNLRVNDFSIIVQKACAANPEFEVYEWINESAFRSNPDTVIYTTVTGRKAKRNIIPDRYFVIDRHAQTGFRSRILLELDNATHPNKRFADHKVLPGIAYLRSTAYEARFGGKSGRWLIVTTSDRRLRYLKETTERAAKDDAGVFYLTTFERVTAETVLTEPIWFPGGSDEPVALFPQR